MTSVILENLKHYINGKFVESSNKEQFAFLNPANNEVLGYIPSGTKEDVEKAVIAANRAFKYAWSEIPVSKRSHICMTWID